MTTVVRAALDAQTVSMPAEAATGRVVAELAVELDQLHARRGRRDRRSVADTPLRPGPLDPSGIGPRTGARFVADRRRHTHREWLQVRATPGSHPSPTRHQHPRRVQIRRGNHRFKNAMLLAVFASLRSPDSKAFYDRNGSRARSTMSQSFVSLAAATSSSACSATSSPTGRQPHPPSPRHPPRLPEPLDKNMGIHPPTDATQIAIVDDGP